MTNLSQSNPIKALILDMDGVIWRDRQPIGDLAETFRQIRAKDLRLIMATNNSTQDFDSVYQRLSGWGVEITPDELITSSAAVTYLLKKRFPQGGPVYVIGEPPLVKALEENGFHLGEKDVLAVVVGIDRQINFEKLKRATLLIRSGALFLGTNPDRTFPTPEGIIPGAGAFLGLLEIASDRKPEIAGKPNPTLFEMALERLGTLPEETLVVGDRLETDILGGHNVGCRTGFVLSGISTREQLKLFTPSPDLVAEDLAHLVSSLV